MQYPTDQEYLEQLMREQCNSPEYPQRDADDIANNAIARGTWPADRKNDLVRLIIEGNTPTLLLQGYITKVLKSLAGTLLASSEKHVSNVPVGILAVPEVNAFAIRTPRGGAAIVLNVALLNHFKFLMYSVMAILLRETRFAFGKHHSDDEYLATITEVREALMTGRCVCPGNIPVWDCLNDYSSPEQLVIEFLLRTSSFVLLHEYGHVYCGHLNAASLRSLKLGARDVDVYSTSHKQEFEADEFAIKHMMMHHRNDPSAISGLIAAVGIMFLFFDLCEGGRKSGTGTHPRSIDRLKRIKDISQQSSNSDVFMENIENIFDVLRGRFDAQLP